MDFFLKSKKKNTQDEEYPKCLHLECSCGTSEHILKFSLFLEKDPRDNELYTEVQLFQYRGIFTRLWMAIKYVFGYKCKYGYWDCFNMRREDADKLIEMLQLFKKQ